MNEPTKLVRRLNSAGSAIQSSPLRWWAPCSPDAASALCTSNPAVIGSATGVLTAFPDLAVDAEWIVAEGDMVVFFHSMTGTH